MALTPSNPFPTATIAPDFTLPDAVSGRNLSLSDLKGENGTVILFICNHCPFVVHINKGLVELANDYLDKGVTCIAISSNDINNYPQDAPPYMKAVAEKMNYPFPYLYDESQAVAKAYDAACTPDFYVFDQHLLSVYHGRFDTSRPGSEIPVTGEDIRKAIDVLLDGKAPLEHQSPSIGCGIKWK